MTNDVRAAREAQLIKTVKERLPGFADTCASEVEVILLQQGAFAADYQDEEYVLLGMAIKYAGLFHKNVHVIRNEAPSLAFDQIIQ